MVSKQNQKRKGNNQSIKEKIVKGIKNLNKFRAPEAKSELIWIKNKKFLVKFSGPMCLSCGVYDYFDDLTFELKSLGLETKILGFQSFGNYFLVSYRIVR